MKVFQNLYFFLLYLAIKTIKVIQKFLRYFCVHSLPIPTWDITEKWCHSWNSEKCDLHESLEISSGNRNSELKSHNLERLSVNDDDCSNNYAASSMINCAWAESRSNSAKTFTSQEQQGWDWLLTLAWDSAKVHESQ